MNIDWNYCLPWLIIWAMVFVPGIAILLTDEALEKKFPMYKKFKKACVWHFKRWTKNKLRRFLHN